MNAVSFSAVSKIYGPNPEITWPLLAEGASKAEIQTRTDHVVALHDVTLEIAAGGFLSSWVGRGRASRRCCEPSIVSLNRRKARCV